MKCPIGLDDSPSLCSAGYCTACQILKSKEKHNKFVESLGPELKKYKQDKTPYEVMVEYLEGLNE